MIQIKSCPRCRGDMMLEEYHSERELVCLQCGNRIQPPAALERKPSPVTTRLKRAA